ncbi:hypothetical protein B0G83_1481 [Paraburkholderia sp. BL21I4N1]|nr:hypothetical protein B0G83_1481 [Paraburkholderia sp. BL21I4N1]
MGMWVITRLPVRLPSVLKLVGFGENGPYPSVDGDGDGDEEDEEKIIEGQLNGAHRLRGSLHAPGVSIPWISWKVSILRPSCA